MRLKLFNTNSTYASLVMNSTSILLLAAVIIIISITFFYASVESSQKYSSDKQCITLLSRLDDIKLNQNDATIQTLIKDSCTNKKRTIQNKEQLNKEFELCNSKAQELIEQESFLSELRTDNVCMICSSITTSSINYEFSTRDILNEVNQYRTIKHSTINLKKSNEQFDDRQQLFFKINEKNNANRPETSKEISFQITSNPKNNGCSSFLNS